MQGFVANASTTQDFPLSISPLKLLSVDTKIEKEGKILYYIYVPEKAEAELPLTVDRLLRSLGASRRLIGFDYTVYMINQLISEHESIRLITKRLYPETARHFGVTTYSVERALRTLIRSCWLYGDRAALCEIAGRELTAPPSNSDFLDMLAAYIKNQN